jgi:HD-GYP domain-containing protein (c-di-GMP phosphodiesterase class II)
LLARLGAKLDAIGPGEAFRLGGDEFCLLVPLGDADAESIIDAALEALHERGEGFNVTSSFGAVLLPDESRGARDALRLADERLYAQKHSKRSRRDRPHEALMQAIYEREPALHGHVNDVAELSHAAGTLLGLSRSEIEQLHRAALLHDVGKIAIPDEIVRKPGPLTEDEWSFVRRHTLVGERILTASPALRPVARIVRSTHERWDGGGYPDGLAAEEIPHAARIIAVCDAFHAMTSSRPYRETFSVDEALEELGRCAGTQFDPEVVACVVGLVQARSTAAA